MVKNFLVFSLALNGYQWVYRAHLKSHRAYARKLGAKYVCVTRPTISKLGVECCWLKLYLLRAALLSGYDAVLVLDADTFVNPGTPDIRQNIEPDKHIYMAKGYSKRFNSGVLLATKHELALTFLKQVIGNRLRTLPAADDVGWGENGHIIYYAKRSSVIAEMSQCWNNTQDSCLDDFIRHYNHGPLRESRVLNLIHKVLPTICRFIGMLRVMGTRNVIRRLPSHWFSEETQRILAFYPELLAKDCPSRFSQSAFSICKNNRLDMP